MKSYKKTLASVILSTLPCLGFATNVVIMNNTNKDVYLSNVKEPIAPGKSITQSWKEKVNTTHVVGSISAFDGTSGPTIILDGPAKGSMASHESSDNRRPHATVRGNRSTSISTQPQAVSSDAVITGSWTSPMSMKITEHLDDANKVDFANFATLAITHPDTPIDDLKAIEARYAHFHAHHKYVSENFTADIAAHGGDMAAIDKMGGATGSIQGEQLIPFRRGSAGPTQDLNFRWWMIGDKKHRDAFMPREYKGNDPTTKLDNLGAGDYYLEIDDTPQNKSNIDGLFVFGDSLSDTHNMFNMSNGGMPRGPFYNGRFSNGPIWSDDFTNLTGIPVYSFAFGGAEVLPHGSPNIKTENMNGGAGRHAIAPYGVYVSGSSYAPNLPDLQEQLTQAFQIMKSEMMQEKQIAIMVEMGGDDFLALDKGATPTEINSKANAVAHEIINQVTETISNLMAVAPGARPLVIYTELSNLSKSPSFAGTSANAHRYVQALNSAVEADSANIQNFRTIKLATTMQSMLNHPASYGMMKTINSDPTSDHIFGNLSSDKGWNKFNMLGYQDHAVTPWHDETNHVRGTIHFKNLISYDGHKVGKTLFSGILHPSAKVHALSAYELIWELAQPGPQGQIVMYLSDYSNSPIMQDINSSKGISTPNETQSFKDLIAASETYAEPRPDWADGYETFALPGKTLQGSSRTAESRVIQTSQFSIAGHVYHIDLTGEGVLSIYTKTTVKNPSYSYTFKSLDALPKEITKNTYEEVKVLSNEGNTVKIELVGRDSWSKKVVTYYLTGKASVKNPVPAFSLVQLASSPTT